MLTRLRQARERNGYARWERRTDLPLLVLALLFLGVLVAPLAADLSGPQRQALDAVSITIWALFAVDYVARLFLAPARWAFVRQHPLDLIVVLVPMLRPLRALRLLRLLRAASLLGIVNRQAHRSLHARVSAYVAASVVVVLGVAGLSMASVERRADGANITTVGDGLWWAVTTVTTVGYGDRFPVTPLGRLIAVALMVVGIALLGVVTATIAAWFVDRLQQVEQTAEQTEATLHDVLAELRELRAELAARDAAIGVPVQSALT